MFANQAAKITEALQRLKWTSLETRRRNQRCTRIYKCMNGLIDFDFGLTTKKTSTDTTQCLHLPREKTNKGKQRPTYQASIDFNNLEPELKNANSSSTFKSLLKTYTLCVGISLMYISSPFFLSSHSLIEYRIVCNF